jgi:hypothetical protein
MRSAGCALIPTNEAALPPVEACWEEGSEGEGSEGEGSEGEGSEGEGSEGEGSEGQGSEGQGSEGQGQGSDGEGQGSDGDEELEVCSPAPHCAPPYTPSTPSPRSPSSISLHSHVALPPLTLHLPLCPWPYLRPLTRAALARPFTAVREEALLDPGRAPRSEE